MRPGFFEGGGDTSCAFLGSFEGDAGFLTAGAGQLDGGGDFSPPRGTNSAGFFALSAKYPTFSRFGLNSQSSI